MPASLKNATADTATDTNEIEFGVTNRFYTRRYTEAVTDEARRQLSETPDAGKNPLTIQPYEIFSLTVRGKYFFDKTFGGALIPGQRMNVRVAASEDRADIIAFLARESAKR